MKRGDLYWAELKPRSGSEQQGRRPVVIVSSDGFNEVPAWRSIILGCLRYRFRGGRFGANYPGFSPAAQG